MKLPQSDEDVAAFVASELVRLDETPAKRNWRYHALGQTMGEAIGSAPRQSRLDFVLTPGEVRVLRRCALDRGIETRRWLRMAVGTAAVACEGVDPDLIPSLTKFGLLRPR